MKKRGGLFSNRFPPLEARHEVSGLNSLFNGDHLTFAEYVSRNREMLRNVRSSISTSNIDKAVDGNAPFALEPSSSAAAGKDKKYQRGILLTHGLSDSPYFMRYVASSFQEAGFRVLAVLLPGHGSCPGDLLDVTWQEWVKTVAYGVDQLSSEVDEIYLGGYSAGGALSIYHSLRDKRVRGLFLFAPALEITRRAAYAGLHKWVSWLLPRQKWVYIKEDKDIYKYESFAKNTAVQMYRLTQALSEALQQHQLTIPIFAVASVDDKTVHTSATIAFMAQQSNSVNQLILYTTDRSRITQANSDKKIIWVNSVVPEQKILSSAHTAILLAPEDTHYGMRGDYANCVHYYPEQLEKYAACKLNPDNYCLGEVSDTNLEIGILRRLMYNPNFPVLKYSITKFIENL
jgi:esterase/lipase